MMIVTKALKPGVDHSAASLNSQRKTAIKNPGRKAGAGKERQG